jgi:branched-subunit amino acid aminotransferase/4-amino-4-deoxychorismate lyase
MTRNFVLDLAANQYPVQERDIALDELFSADEVFITATNKEIVPIVTIDDKQIGSGKPGAIALNLLDLFRAATLRA